MIRVFQNECRTLVECAKLVKQCILIHGRPSSQWLVTIKTATSTPLETRAAQRIISTFQTMNRLIYDFQKMRDGNLLPTALTQKADAVQKADVVQNDSTKVARIPLVITRTTRKKLKDLGFDDAAIAKLRPAEALEIVQNNLPFIKSRDLFEILGKDQGDTKHQIRGSSEIKPEKLPGPQQHSPKFDMGDALKQLRAELALEKEVAKNNRAAIHAAPAIGDITSSK